MIGRGVGLPRIAAAVRVYLVRSRALGVSTLSAPCIVATEVDGDRTDALASCLLLADELNACGNCRRSRDALGSPGTAKLRTSIGCVDVVPWTIRATYHPRAG
jgi:hypothetical protein